MKRTANILTVATFLALLITLVALSPEETRVGAQAQCGCLTAPAIYVAKLSQSGTNDPVATIITNTLGDIVWHRNQFDTGVYYGALEGAFTEDKTWIANPARDNSGDVTTGSASVFTTDTSGTGAVYINAYGTPEDGSLQRRDIDGAIYVRIEVFE